MILAIDIGNSCVKLGVFNKRRILVSKEFPNNAKSDIRNSLSILASGRSINKIGISSVVPGLNNFWRSSIKQYFRIAPVFISTKLRLPLKLKIQTSSGIGADRICNAAAGYEFFKRKENVIIIDFGTATTYDVVLKNGEYLGGIIAAGISTSAYALKLRTSKLPYLKEFVFPENPLGKNTVRAMQSGIMYSALYSMEGIIKLIQKTQKKKFKIILTGGLAKFIHKRTSYKTVLINNLVLYGINYILKYLAAKTQRN